MKCKCTRLNIPNEFESCQVTVTKNISVYRFWHQVIVAKRVLKFNDSTGYHSCYCTNHCIQSLQQENRHLQRVDVTCFKWPMLHVVHQMIENWKILQVGPTNKNTRQNWKPQLRVGPYILVDVSIFVVRQQKKPKVCYRNKLQELQVRTAK